MGQMANGGGGGGSHGYGGEIGAMEIAGIDTGGAVGDHPIPPGPKLEQARSETSERYLLVGESCFLGGVLRCFLFERRLLIVE